MTDSIALGPDGQANHTLAVLRNSANKGELAPHVEFMPGFNLHTDPELGLAGQYRSPEGQLLEIDARPTGAGAWNALHLALPADDLRRYGVLGFAMRSASPELLVIRACLRSGIEGGFEDCFFDKHILVRPEASSHVDALALAHRSRLPPEAPWRELVLFLPTRGFRLSLIDLRVFLV